MSGLRLRQLAIGLGVLAVIAALIGLAWGVVGGDQEAWPSPFSALLHLVLLVVIPAAGTSLVARREPGAGERVGLLLLAANGGFQLATVVFFVATGAGLASLVSVEGAPALFAVLAGIAAVARLASLRPWLAHGVIRHPARYVAAAGAAVLAAVEAVLAALQVLGVGAWVGGIVAWPTILVVVLVMAAAVVIILRAPEAAGAAAVAAVLAGYVLVGLVGTVWGWLAPPADMVAIPPDLRMVGDAGALMLLVLGASWLASQPAEASHARQPVA